VTIEARFYNTFRELLDTRRYDVGTMGPGEVRAFVVSGKFADNIHNVFDYECRAYYR
jgi:hypothetical protein